MRGSDQMKKIMFICTGNICRSSMAEVILRKLAEEKGKEVESYSSGIFAQNGEQATQYSVEALKEIGIDLANHKATNVKDAKLDEMDLILCMTKDHKQMILQHYPDLKEKVYTLEEYTNGIQEDVKDPWGYDIEIYRKCSRQIYQAIEKLVDKI